MPTARAIAQKTAAGARPEAIGVEEWIKQNVAGQDEAALRGATNFIETIEELGGTAGARKASLCGTFKTQEGKLIIPAYFVSTGKIQLAFANLATRSALSDARVRKAFYDEFESVLGPLSIKDSTKKLSGFPAFEAAALSSQEIRTAFMAIMRRLVDAAIEG